MIEIEFPLSGIVALLIVIVLITCILGVIYAIITKNWKWAVLFVMLFLFTDFFSFLASEHYRNTPMNGYNTGYGCIDYPRTTHTSPPLETCKYPTHNPFEEIQFIHPLKWGVTGIGWVIDEFNRAISIKVS